MSISLYAAKRDEKNNLMPVYSMDLLNFYSNLMVVGDDEPVRNPKYEPRVNVEFNQGNARYIFEDQLGIEIVHDYFEIRIHDLMVKVSKRLLQTDLDEYSRRKFIEILELCSYGLERGATHIYGA
ncbi:hypothetical protein AU106_gp156 [Sinorhizobium phage phiM9]|uniref:Uncharacterized protein n=1 Tax=Sinorhizobium phage phiM9 TaxID=1636182 RepID=A0A0F6R523_9CAUD|nr:hypothetical protein AU106_gp156 [Sinorhizobium phage phiM9]AKE44787.1 hypothetical protein Sm_phiM9_159 [Sinorhizobium phage phiM9]